MAAAPIYTVDSEEDITVYCLPCDRDEIRVPAFGYCTDCIEHLCETCFKLHRRHTLSRDHKLIDKSDMPQTQYVSTKAEVSGGVNQNCSKHKIEIIKFYCENHKVFLCNVCVTLKHQITACQIKYIPDISSQVVNSKDYFDMLTTIDTVIKQCNSLLAVVKKTTGLSNRSLTDVLSEIAIFRSEIEQRLDKLAKETAEIAMFIQCDNNTRQQAIQKQCDNITTSLDEKRNKIKEFNTLKQADKLFFNLKEAEKMVENNRNELQQLTFSEIKEYKFLPNETIRSLFEKEKIFGSMVQKSIKQNTSLSTIDLKSRKMTYLGEIYVKALDDKEDCCITGITLVNSVHLVLSDHDNKSVKLIDTNNKAIVDKLELDGNPWDVTLVTSTEIAVTLPNTQTIQFIKICLAKFENDNSIKVDGHCQGLSCFQGKLVVTYTQPAKLQILEPSGTILKTVLGQNILSYPEYVATNIHSIYISDWKLKRVTRLTWQGTVRGAFCGLLEPSGITLTEEGTVFVGDKHVVEELSQHCSEKQVMLKDNKCARAICWCEEQKVLYFSSEVKKANNNLQMYILS